MSMRRLSRRIGPCFRPAELNRTWAQDQNAHELALPVRPRSRDLNTVYFERTFWVPKSNVRAAFFGASSGRKSKSARAVVGKPIRPVYAETAREPTLRQSKRTTALQRIPSELHVQAMG